MFHVKHCMVEYLAAAFSKEEITGELAGYLKVNENQAQADLREVKGLEIERIYLRKRFQGQGLGKALLEKGPQITRRKQKEYVWLGVWERNEKAITFYEQMG